MVGPLITIICLLLFFLLSRLLAQYLEPNRSTASFDPDLCLRIIKRTALVCIALLVAEIFLIAKVKPVGSCSSWRATLEIAGPMAVYVCIPAALVPMVQVVRWERFVQRASEGIAAHPERMNVNRLFLVVCVGWCVFCSTPMWVLLGTCAREWV